MKKLGERNWARQRERELCEKEADVDGWVGDTYSRPGRCITVTKIKIKGKWTGIGKEWVGERAGEMRSYLIAELAVLWSTDFKLNGWKTSTNQRSDHVGNWATSVWCASQSDNQSWLTNGRKISTVKNQPFLVWHGSVSLLPCESREINLFLAVFSRRRGKYGR